MLRKLNVTNDQANRLWAKKRRVYLLKKTLLGTLAVGAGIGALLTFMYATGGVAQEWSWSILCLLVFGPLTYLLSRLCGFFLMRMMSLPSPQSAQEQVTILPAHAVLLCGSDLSSTTSDPLLRAAQAGSVSSADGMLRPAQSDQSAIAPANQRPLAERAKERRMYVLKKTAMTTTGAAFAAVSIGFVLVTFLLVHVLLRQSDVHVRHMAITIPILWVEMTVVAALNTAWFSRSCFKKAANVARVPPLREQRISALPAEEVLLRGVDQPAATPEELLRAAQAGTEPKEELLRAEPAQSGEQPSEMVQVQQARLRNSGRN